MNDFGVWSVLPPVMAVTLALLTRQIVLSLLVGIWAGFVILQSGNPILGTLATLDGLVQVFDDPGNTRVILFTFLVGGMIALIQRSGGVAGFILRIVGLLERIGTRQADRGNRRVVEITAVLTGMLLFIESNISSLTVGTLFRPVFDKLKIPREKLAYIADSTSAPSCILFPFNAWGAYIVGLIAAQGIDSASTVLVSAVLYNFYPMLAIALMIIIILSRKDYGEMAAAERRAESEGKILRDGAVPMVSNEISMLEMKQGLTPSAANLAWPLLSMVALMPMFLMYTGWAGAQEALPGVKGLALAGKAMAEGSGSKAVLYSVSGAILVAMALYRVRGVLRIREMVDLILRGMAGMLQMALVMTLAFAIGSLSRELGTGQYVADLTSPWISPALVPALIFLVSSFIAFSTGTSWGTFAIMIAIAVPMAQGMDTNVSLAIAAALGGGVFGDHCSPTSDTSLISSMAASSDHIDHVRTQLPYALTAGIFAFSLYLILGILTP
ncbi:MAG: Na+/H+ antiporter NhaC family protein [Pseudomonadota bacterium]